MRAQDLTVSQERTSVPKPPTIRSPSPPLITTAPIKDNNPQSGWDYWSRVYSEDAPVPPASRDVRISDMLSSDTLVRAKLLFLNVPTLPTAHKNIILNLIKKEIGEDISIQDVIAMPGKWFLNFYRPEDALRVLKRFNGFAFRSHVLAVRFCYPDGTYGDETALCELVQCTHNNKLRLFEQRAIVQETFAVECWTDCELAVILKFERELVAMLQNHAYLPYHNVLQSMRNLFTINSKSAGTPITTGSYFVADALTQWPTGFIRIFNRTVKVVNNTICLSTSSFYTQRIHDSAMEGGCSVHRNSWEPFVPEDIRSDVQLVQYSLSFLNHFGPQHIQVDAPLRILAQSLRGTWPKSGRKLAELLTELSSGFVLINDVIYLSANENHHELVIDNLASFQDDCTDFAFLQLANSEKSTKCEFEEL